MESTITVMARNANFEFIALPLSSVTRSFQNAPLWVFDGNGPAVVAQLSITQRR
jgi:hypothetical protein